MTNRGWSAFGRHYHAAKWVTGPLASSWRSSCGVYLDQTELKNNGDATGALVPDDLRPCRRCWPEASR